MIAIIVLCCLVLLSIGAGVGFYYYNKEDGGEESSGPAPADTGSSSGSRIAVKIGARIRLHNKVGNGHVYMTRPEDATNLGLFKKGAKVRFFNLVTLDNAKTFPEVTKTLTSDVKWDMATGSIYNSLYWDAAAEPADLPEHVFADVEVTM